MSPETFFEPDFKKIFEAGPGLHLILDRSLVIVAASDSWLRATGLRREDVLGRYVFEALPDNPHDPGADSVRNSLASFKRVLRSGEMDAMGLQRHDVRKPDSEAGDFDEHYWSAVNYPILDGDGSVAYIFHKVEDATEYVRRRQQATAQDHPADELRQQNLRLEADIYARFREAAETSRQLKQANEELAQLYRKSQELDTLRSHLFANISHELRTPLTLILSPVERLLQQDSLDDEVRHDLQVVQRNARLLHRHVDNFLDIARLEAGKMRMRYARTDLASLTRLVAANFDSLAADRRIRFAVQTPAELAAEVDVAKVERVVINLLANAFKFTPEGGGITLSLEQHQGRARIVVEDTGPGVPEHLREVIFERFRQGDGGISRQFGGTGLGLAIVRELVALHRGTAGVTEAPGGGARFTLELPLTAPAGIPVSAPASLPEPGGARRELDLLEQIPPSPALPLPRDLQSPHILVVEDNPEMNDFLARTLGRQYWVTRAFDGREGLTRALAYPHDLILADLMMPGMSGEEMVAELRRHPFLDEVPIVMLTAKADDDLRIRMLRHGVQDFLHKPFITEEVLARVAGLLAERRRNVGRLQQSEERYQTLFEKMTEGFMLGEIIRDDAGVPVDFRYIAINPAFERQFDIPRSKIIGKTGREFAAGIGADLFQRYGRVAVTGEPVHFEVRFPSGRFCLLYAFQTGPGQFGVFFVDITERRRAEEQLRLLNDELEQRIELRTRELQESQLQVLQAEKLSAMGKLSASFAHEFNNPLQSVMTILQGFHNWLDLQGEDRDFLESAIHECRRMKNLILSLQDFSQPSSGRKIYMDVHAALDSVLLLYSTDFLQKKIIATVEYAEHLPKIRAIPDQIKHVFVNLLNNAVDACTPQGGTITIRTWREGQRVAVAIQDTGMGIDPERIDLIFQPFYSTKPEVKGTGLGLSICHGIVQHHQGEIRVESRPGTGSTFTVLLPITLSS